MVFSFNPPTSSYVTRTFLSIDISDEIFTSVVLSISITPFGTVFVILKSMEFPKIITAISSPCVIGNPFNLFFTKSVYSLSTVTESFSGVNVIIFAIFVVTFLIFTISFNVPPTFFLVCPSILIISGNFSSSSTGQITAQLVLEPIISIMSPGSAFRKSIACGPTLARFLPMSLCFASPILICKGSSLRTKNHLLPVILITAHA